MQTSANSTGLYLSIAGIIVTILAQFGISADVTSIATVIGLIVTIIGVIKARIEHNKTQAALVSATTNTVNPQS